MYQRFRITPYRQVDNQLPWSPLPVLLAPEPEDAHSGAPPPWVLQVTIISKEEPGHTAQEYPYIGLHTPDIAWNISVHEPIVWRLLDLYEKLGLDRLGGSPEAGQQQAATVDPYIGVHLLDFSEHRLKLTVEMAPGQRPPGALGVWGPLLTAIGNTNAMHLVFHAVVRENLFMRRSEFVNAMIAHVARDLLSQVGDSQTLATSRCCSRGSWVRQFSVLRHIDLHLHNVSSLSIGFRRRQ